MKKKEKKHYIQLSFLFMMRRMSRGKCYTAATTSSVMIDGWISTKGRPSHAMRRHMDHAHGAAVLHPIEAANVSDDWVYIQGKA